MEARTIHGELVLPRISPNLHVVLIVQERLAPSTIHTSEGRRFIGGRYRDLQSFQDRLEEFGLSAFPEPGGYGWILKHCLHTCSMLFWGVFAFSKEG